jgi:uncharacterized protein YcaQ
VARPDSLSAAQARRLHLHAQGFGEKRPTGRVDKRHVRKVFERLGLLQIDSVNVLVRSHYLPVFSRLGPYPRALLDHAANSTPRRLVEYWAHQASFTAPATHRLLGFRMERAAQEAWAGLRRHRDPAGLREGQLLAQTAASTLSCTVSRITP